MPPKFKVDVFMAFLHSAITMALFAKPAGNYRFPALIYNLGKDGAHRTS
jgi:hypothetical protein